LVLAGFCEIQCENVFFTFFIHFKLNPAKTPEISGLLAPATRSWFRRRLALFGWFRNFR